jgi:hypothetical protein
MGLKVPVPNFEEIKLDSHPVHLSNKACDPRQVILPLMPFLIPLPVLLGAYYLSHRKASAMPVLTFLVWNTQRELPPDAHALT